MAVSETTIALLLDEIGECTTRPGLIDTPKRAAKAWLEWTAGYAENPRDVLKTFVETHADELVVVRDIPFYSHCEHHLAPFFGVVHIGYVPNGCIVGLSKFPRLIDIYARRLQVQERMTTQIASAIATHLKPMGVGVVVEARHLCMESRGISRPGSTTVTSALAGCVKTEADCRNEFMSLVRSNSHVAI